MSEVFELASEYVDDACRLSPLLASSLRVGDPSGDWDDFGPGGVESWRDLRHRYAKALSAMEPLDENDELAHRVMTTSWDQNEVSYQAGDHYLSLRHMASSFQQIRSSFQTLPSENPSDQEIIRERLQTIDRPFSGYKQLLAEGLTEGAVVPKRQVRSVVSQARHLASPQSSLFDLAVTDGVDHARGQYSAFADWLESEYLRHALDDDRSDPELYARSANHMVGLDLDIDEVYDWGWEEFFRLRDEMKRIADEVKPGASVAEAKEFCENDPSMTVEGHAALLEFVLQTLDEAKANLIGQHFDVPEVIVPLTAQMAPAADPLGVYYLRPSEDFTRPGGVWYSTGDQTVFPLYQHRSTAYHEGFPGHHLQIATAMLHSSSLSRYQRLMTWCPGYGEGWAMYAEVLMGELGYLDEPASYFGMLAKQIYRASRVVVDIGLHLGRVIHPSSPLDPGSVWTFETACEFMETYGFRTKHQAKDEVLRYLGWPGQAISYKLGEREILRLRDEARRTLGDGFDLKKFHATVLSTGTVRLDILRDVLFERLSR